jgi:hypothetical protein
MSMYECCNQIAVAIGEELPIIAVLQDDPPIGEDSGFRVVFSDAPTDGRDVTPEHCTLTCVCSLIEDHPEVGAALDTARAHGRALLYTTGEWVGAPR